MVPVDDQSIRLNRIEVKLDKITEAMTMIARVDEKLVANQARTDRLEYRLDEQESDIDGLKSVVGYNTQTVKVAERFIWILISSIIGLATYYMR